MAAIAPAPPHESISARSAIAAMSNRDISWNGDYLGLEPHVSGNAAQYLLKAGPEATPLLLKALHDPSKYVAAHVILTLRNTEALRPSASEWNDLSIELRPDRTVRYDVRQMATLQELWARRLPDVR